VTEQEVREVQQAHDVSAEVEAELAQLRVSDVLLHTASTVAQLAYRELHAAERDLEQVRLALESLEALLPLLAGTLPHELEGDFQAVLADVRLGYAEAARA
jgi:hypothetical protein